MWVPSPPPGKSYHGGCKLLDTFRLGASALHFKHLLIAGGRLLDFDSAALLLLLVTSLFLIILLLRSSATQKNTHLKKKKEIQTGAEMHPNPTAINLSISDAPSPEESFLTSSSAVSRLPQTR